MTKKEKSLLENKIYKMVKSYLNENSFYMNPFMPTEKKEKGDKKEDDDERSEDDMIKLSDYEDLSQDVYGKLKSIIPVLTSTFDDDVNTYNLTHSQLAYEMYPDLDSDTARSKFSQKVTGKKRFTSKEINQLFNIISGKIA